MEYIHEPLQAPLEENHKGPWPQGLGSPHRRVTEDSSLVAVASLMAVANLMADSSLMADPCPKRTGEVDIVERTQIQ